MSSDEQEIVILVHGTFAGPEPGKLNWWQTDSEVWQAIRKRLPEGTRLAEATEIFWWTGENFERDRYHGGIRLLKRLLKLEKQGRGYHLIGHSHGGSVIWHALQEAVRRRIGRKPSDSRLKTLELPNLRSWATVGTPFLQYRESRMGRWPGAFVSKLLFLVSWIFTLGLGFGLLELLIAQKYVPALKDFQWASLRQPDQLQHWLIAAVVCITAMAIAAIPGLALHVWSSAIRREALAVRQTAMVRNQAMLDFGTRWLGLWSREDEAISGLKATVKLRMQLLPRLQFRTNRVFQYDRRIWSYRFLLRWLLAPILNTTFVPYGNSMILSTVSKSAQGDDRPGCRITSVSEGPLCFQDRYQYPMLPPQVDAKLIAAANQHLIDKAPDFVPKFRSFLADYSSGVALLGGAIQKSGFAFSGNEMVHTSYFDNAHVLDLLAHHVRSQQRNARTANPRGTSLDKWYQTIRHNVHHNVLTNPSVQQRSLVHLGTKNLPARWSLRLAVVGMLCVIPLAFQPELADLNLTFAEFEYVVLGVSALFAFVAVILGRLGQLRAERGARFRRTANVGVNLGLLWLLVSLAILLGMSTQAFGVF